MKKIENESVSNFLFKTNNKDTWLQDFDIGLVSLLMTLSRYFFTS